jgi:hypothetical protein
LWEGWRGGFGLRRGGEFFVFVLFARWLMAV